VFAILAFLCLWVLGAALAGGSMSWLSLTGLYLALLAIAVSPAVTPSRMPGASFFAALGSAAAVPLVALFADTLGVMRVSNELALMTTAGAALSVVAAAIVGRGMTRAAPRSRAPAVRGAPEEPEALPSEAVSPRGMGRYRLIERVGAGGMGEVWRAEHDTLARPAALKLIRRSEIVDDAREEESLERFRQEAQVTAQLTSPHTVELYDFGVTDEGALYYAMELLDGMTIRTLVEDHGPLADERVAFLMRQACHSLVEAHDVGLVHRDLKPDNLFVARRGRDADFLKVLDFGLVKELGAGGKILRRTPRRQLTMAGARPGTPGFMAPEQIEAVEAIDQRADVYALACVGYFALTGTAVFEGSVDGQILFAHVQVEPDPPSERLGRAVHGGLEALLLRCLAKDAASRPSMEELDEALGQLSFASPWSQRRARAWWASARLRARTRAMRIPVVGGTAVARPAPRGRGQRSVDEHAG